MTTRAWLRRSAIGLGSLLALALGLIAFAHTRSGRGLLAYLPGVGVCPLGKGARLDAAQRDRARAEALAAVRGADRADARPALGFTLGTTTRADIVAWGAERGIACAGQHGDARLACRDVPSAATDAGRRLDEVLFLFDREGVLVGVESSSSGLDAGAAAAVVSAAADRLERHAGGPTISKGVASAEYLTGATLRRASVELRFSDYRAVVSAVNLGPRGIHVREQYVALGADG